MDVPALPCRTLAAACRGAPTDLLQRLLHAVSAPLAGTNALSISSAAQRMSRGRRIKRVLGMASLLTPLLSDVGLAAGDVARRAQIYRSCVACHALEPGLHLTGPSLGGVWNRPAGEAEGFSHYSDALRGAGFAWDAVASFRESVSTLSNAMDVGAPSNFERLESMYSPAALRGRIRGASVDDSATIDRIAATAEEFDTLVDPHTAVGLEAVARERVRRSGDERPGDERPGNGDEQAAGGPFVVLSTAHPAKFADTVSDATGRDVPVPERLSMLEEMPESFESIDSKTDTLVDYLRTTA